MRDRVGPPPPEGKRACGLHGYALYCPRHDGRAGNHADGGGPHQPAGEYLPSERAKALKMQLETIKHQGGYFGPT